MNDFNFELVKISPKELIILILINDSTRDNYLSYLLEKQRITINDRDIIIEYLGQSNFNLKELFEKLGEEEHFKVVKEKFSSPHKNQSNLHFVL